MTGRRGIWPVLYAFFDADGRLDRALMRRQVEVCLASGAQGLAVLGLATEVGKLSRDERLAVAAWAAEDLAGRAPLAVTVAEGSTAAAVEMASEAASIGADCVILQPPPARGCEEIEYIRFFGTIADRAPLAVAIQNAPEYLGFGLSPAGLRTLCRAHPNVAMVKGEGTAVAIRKVVEALAGLDREVTVFNGRGGLELPDTLRAGCAGLIPAPEAVDLQVRIWTAMARGDEAEADRLYAVLLPLVAFVMQGIEHFLCYGKRALALRLGLPLEAVHDRGPAVTPTEFGLACLRRFAAGLGPLPEPGSDAPQGEG